MHIIQDEIDGLKYIGRQRLAITCDDGAAVFSMVKFARERGLADESLQAAVDDLKAEGVIES